MARHVLRPDQSRFFNRNKAAAETLYMTALFPCDTGAGCKPASRVRYRVENTTTVLAGRRHLNGRSWKHHGGSLHDSALVYWLVATTVMHDSPKHLHTPPTRQCHCLQDASAIEHSFRLHIYTALPLGLGFGTTECHSASALVPTITNNRQTLTPVPLPQAWCTLMQRPLPNLPAGVIAATALFIIIITRFQVLRD